MWGSEYKDSEKRPGGPGEASLRSYLTWVLKSEYELSLPSGERMLLARKSSACYVREAAGHSVCWEGAGMWAKALRLDSCLEGDRQAGPTGIVLCPIQTIESCRFFKQH